MLATESRPDSNLESRSWLRSPAWVTTQSGLRHTSNSALPCYLSQQSKTGMCYCWTQSFLESIPRGLTGVLFSFYSSSRLALSPGNILIRISIIASVIKYFHCHLWSFFWDRLVYVLYTLAYGSTVYCNICTDVFTCWWYQFFSPWKSQLALSFSWPLWVV